MAPKPKSRDVHVDGVLCNISLGSNIVTVGTGRCVFYLSESGRLPTASEGPGPLPNKKQKQKFLLLGHH